MITLSEEDVILVSKRISRRYNRLIRPAVNEEEQQKQNLLIQRWSSLIRNLGATPLRLYSIRLNEKTIDLL